MKKFKMNYAFGRAQKDWATTDKLAKYMKKHGLTTSELADKLNLEGVTAKSIHNWVYRGRCPIVVLKKLGLRGINSSAETKQISKAREKSTLYVCLVPDEHIDLFNQLCSALDIDNKGVL